MSVKLRDLLVGKDYFVVDHDDHDDHDDDEDDDADDNNIDQPVRRRSCKERWNNRWSMVMDDDDANDSGADNDANDDDANNTDSGEKEEL